MQRYFIAPEQFAESRSRITGEDAHHILNVMRAKAGEQLIVSDGLGREAIATITALSKAEVTVEVGERRDALSEPKLAITVAQAMPKGDKMETVIQKGTEIGAGRFIPFMSERTIVQYDAKKEGKRLERWTKIAKEAAEQAHRGRIPAIEPVRSWKGLLQTVSSFDAVFLCYEKETNLELRAQLNRLKANQGNGTVSVMVVIGPEGGFSEKEIEEAEAAGCRTISLGKRILRTETAALVALSCILYEYGEIGG